MLQSTSLLEDIATLGRKVRTAFDAAAREKGLSLARARLLARLRSEAAGKSQKQLAEELEVEAATLVGLLDGLEQSGAIVRIASDDDRRVKRVELTEDGGAQADMINDIISTFRTELMEGVDAVDIETVRRVICRIQANLVRLS